MTVHTLEVLGLGLVLGAVFGFLVGYWLRAEHELARRVTGKTMEFDRPRIGA